MVQGVGFRFTAEHFARQLNIAGWVKNLSDGRVELLAEADEEALKDFFCKMDNSPLKSYIRDKDVAWGKPTNEFNDFTIRFK